MAERSMSGWWWAVALLLICSAAGAEDASKPGDDECFDDRAGAIRPADREGLRRLCRRAWKEGAAIHVVTLGSLDDLNPRPLSVERVLDELFEDWNVDYERGKLGILLFVPVKEREYRVVLGDDFSERQRGRAVSLIRSLLAPSARRGKLSAGIRRTQEAYLEQIILPHVREKKRKEKRRRPMPE